MALEGGKEARFENILREVCKTEGRSCVKVLGTARRQMGERVRGNVEK
jgi:hypothetical protein